MVDGEREGEKEEGEGRGGRERGGTGCWMDEVDEVVNEKSVSRRRNCISLYTTLKRLDSHSIAPIILQPHPPSFYAVFHCSKPLLCIQRNKACSGNEGLIIMTNQSEQSKSWDCVPKTRKI